jgi:hypothetical protein
MQYDEDAEVQDNREKDKYHAYCTSVGWFICE